jgi:hypothetical protein
MVNFALQNVPGWKDRTSCTPTALAAIFGYPLDEIKPRLQQAAAADGQNIPLDRRDYAGKHWRAVVRDLGAPYTVIEDYTQEPHDRLLTINRWIERNTHSSTVLVYCDDKHVSPTKQDATGHLFAAQGPWVVDTYTLAQLEQRPKIPSSWPDYRVKRVYEVTVPTY